MKRIKSYLIFKESVDLSNFDWSKDNTKFISERISHNISILVDETFIKIDIDKEEGLIVFYTKSGRIFKMYHEEDYGESVTIDDIEGDIDDIIGSPLLVSEESTNSDDLLTKAGTDYIDSFTWTFYRFATIKGWVTIKWFGESNGYYSESVDLFELVPNNIYNLKKILLADLRISKDELEERIKEFNIIVNNKIDIISIESLYHFYNMKMSKVISSL